MDKKPVIASEGDVNGIGDFEKNSESSMRFAFDFRRIFKDFLSQKIFVFGFFFFTALIVFPLLLWVFQPKYTATVLLLRKTDALEMGGDSQSFVDMMQKYTVSTLAETIPTIPNLKQVAERLTLKDTPWQLQKKIKVTTTRQSEIISISGLSTDAAQAAAMANTMADVAIENNAQMYAREAETFLIEYDRRVEEEKVKLNEIDKKVLDYYNTHKLGNGDNQKQGYISRLASIQSKYQDSQSQLNQVRAAQQALRNGNSDNALSAFNPEAQNQIRALELQLSQARSIYTDNHPEIRRLESELRSAKSVITTQTLSNAKYRLENQRQALEADVSQLRSALNLLSSRVADSPDKDFAFDELLKQKEMIQTRYDSLMAVRNRARLIKEGHVSNLQIASYAEVPKHIPFAVPFALAAILALLISILTAITAFSIRFALWYKLKTRREIETISRQSVCLELPKVRQTSQLPGPMDVRQTALRKLLLTESEKHPTIMVTSCYPGDGKTFAIIVMARNLLKRYEKGIVVDLTPSESSQQKFGVLNPGAPLIDVIMGRKSLDAAISSTLLDGLSLCYSGAGVDDYISCIEHPSFPALLQTLQSRYQFIIIKTTSVLNSSGLPGIAGSISQCYLIVKPEIRAASLKSAIAGILQLGYSLTSIIMNSVSERYMSDVHA